MQRSHVRTGVRLSLNNTVAHRARGSAIAENAVITGAVVAVGVGTMLAFQSGIGTFFTSLISRLTGMIP